MIVEKQSHPSELVLLYEKALKADPGNEQILTRLVVNYRKLKDYKNELKYIGLLIKTHQDYYIHRNNAGRSVNMISKKLNIALGRISRAGKELFVPDAIKKLEKRKELVIRRLQNR